MSSHFFLMWKLEKLPQQGAERSPPSCLEGNMDIDSSSFFPRKKISEFFFSSLCILPFDASSNKKATRWHTLWEVLKRKIQSQDHIKARVTRLTAAVRSVRPLFFLLVSLGDKIFPNMSGIISHCIVCAPPPPLQTPLFFTVWRAALTINMSLCGRGCVSEEGSE